MPAHVARPSSPPRSARRPRPGSSRASGYQSPERSPGRSEHRDPHSDILLAAFTDLRQELFKEVRKEFDKVRYQVEDRIQPVFDIVSFTSSRLDNFDKLLRGLRHDVQGSLKSISECVKSVEQESEACAAEMSSVKQEVEAQSESLRSLDSLTEEFRSFRDSQKADMDAALDDALSGAALGDVRDSLRALAEESESLKSSQQAELTSIASALQDVKESQNTTLSSIAETVQLTHSSTEQLLQCKPPSAEEIASATAVSLDFGSLLEKVSAEVKAPSTAHPAEVFQQDSPELRSVHNDVKAVSALLSSMHGMPDDVKAISSMLSSMQGVHGEVKAVSLIINSMHGTLNQVSQKIESRPEVSQKIESRPEAAAALVSAAGGHPRLAESTEAAASTTVPTTGSALQSLQPSAAVSTGTVSGPSEPKASHAIEALGDASKPPHLGSSESQKTVFNPSELGTKAQESSQAAEPRMTQRPPGKHDDVFGDLGMFGGDLGSLKPPDFRKPKRKQ